MPPKKKAKKKKVAVKPIGSKKAVKKVKKLPESRKLHKPGKYFECTIRHYLYWSERRRRLYLKEMISYIDGYKEAFWYYYGKSGGVYIGTGDGVMWQNRLKPLFNLPDLYETRNDTDEDVWWVEGEKDVKTLQSLGLIATCHCIGASGKWYKRYGAWIKDRDVNIIPDDDIPGAKYAREMAEGASKSARKVCIIRLPNPKDIPGYDVTDWVKEQRKADVTDSEIVEQLSEFKQERREYIGQSFQYKLYTPADIMEFENPKYVVDRLILEGCLALLYGPAFGGKSFMALSLVMSIASGRSWQPGGNLEVMLGHILYIAAEGRTNYKYRWMAALQNYYQGKWKSKMFLKRMKFLFNQPKLNTDNIEIVLRTIDKMRQPPVLVVVDTIRKTLKGTIISDEDMDDYCQGGQRIIDEFGSSVLLLGHTPRKDQTRYAGSMAVAGAAGIVMGLQRPHVGMKGEGPVKLKCDDSWWGAFNDIYFNYKQVDVDEAKHHSLYLEPSDYEEFSQRTPKKDSKEDEIYNVNAVLLELTRESKDDGWVLLEDWIKALRKELNMSETKARGIVKVASQVASHEHKGGSGQKPKKYRPQ